MEHLNKHQLILLALLVSFVTSLTTGIVTVSLMDQAPQNVARTITQVIQQTVAMVPAGATSTAAVAVAVSDQVADATDRVIPSVVRLRDGDSGSIRGLGLIVSASGAVMADKNVIDTLNLPQVVFPTGASVPVTISRFQTEGDIAFMIPQRPLSISLDPIEFGRVPRLGSTVWSMNGTSTYELSQGIVNRLEKDPNGGMTIIHTSMHVESLLPGAPLFDAAGSVVGIATKSIEGQKTASFYPVDLVRNGVPR